MKTPLVSGLFALLICVTSAIAQQPERINLQTAISTALSNNHELQGSRYVISAADAQVDQAYSSIYPSVTANVGYNRFLQKPVVFFPGQDGVTRPIVIGSDNAVACTLSVSQVVYNNAALVAKRTADVYSQISRQQLRTKAAEVILNVKKAYYAALLTRDVLLVNEALLANAQEQLKTITALYKAGARPEFDMIRADVAVANLQPVIIQARDNYEMALDNLKMLLGLPSDKAIEPGDNLVRPASDSRVEPDLTSARQSIEEKNSQIQSLKMAAEVNKWVIKLKEADYYPTVSVFGSFQLQGQSDSFSDLFSHMQPTTVVGVNVGYNLFNLWRIKGAVQEATAVANQTQEQLNQATAGLRLQLESVMRKIDYARKRISVSEKTISQAEKGYNLAKVTYKAGAGTLLQISDADLALAQSKLNQLNAVYDYNVALAELEQLLGERNQLTDDGKNVQYSEK